MTAHGSPAGYDNGCRGAAECANHQTGLMTCAEAKTRYNGDWSYRRAVDAGTATAEREQFYIHKRVVLETKDQAEQRRIQRNANQQARRAANGRPSVTTRPKATHGTRNGYQKFKCHTGCPETAWTCTDASNAYERALRARRKDAA